MEDERTLLLYALFARYDSPPDEAFLRGFGRDNGSEVSPPDCQRNVGQWGGSGHAFFAAFLGNDNPNLIFIGRLTAVKRLDLLIEALAMLKEQGKMFNLTLIGDGTERQSLQQLAKVKEVESQVWFYGACYDERTNAELIYNADLCVSPGNVGLTAMHVMMFGTPVVTHNNFSHQMPEFESIHSGITGGFFVQNDVDSLVDCILKWFETHKGKRDEVRKACYKEIDTQWTPEFQMSVIRKNLKV